MSSNVACDTLKVLDLVPFGPAVQNTACYALRLEAPSWKEWTPGQFIMVRPTAWADDMLWARPFCICRLSPQDLVIFFQVQGRGTARMASLKPGDTLDAWGPLGNGFACEPDRPTLMIAGGVGIAPFIGYTQNHPKPWNLWMDFGHRLPLESYPFDSINEKIVADSHLEQGPEDRVRFIAYVEERIAEFAKNQGLVLACGPVPLLRLVQECSKKYGVPAQLSLETRMGCGVGACLGCVCKTSKKWPEPEHAGSWVQTCVKGPVFWADQIDLRDDM